MQGQAFILSILSSLDRIIPVQALKILILIVFAFVLSLYFLYSIEGDTHNGGDVVPGWQLPLADVF